jgi:hypothetical protein
MTLFSGKGAHVPSLQFPPAVKQADNEHYLINCDNVMCLLHVYVHAFVNITRLTSADS